MDRKILTIGIPIYNMEALLPRCLDSVVASKNIDKLDIIAINDGSTDGSLKVAKGYQARFPDSVRVIDKPNGGWGTAINKSIEFAAGKYYKSLDSDDWFDTEGLDKFIALLETIECDMVFTDFNEVNESGDFVIEKQMCGIADKIISLEEHLTASRLHNVSIHGVTYKTSLLKANHFKVLPKYYADLDYIHSPLLFVNEVYVAHINVYQYFYGRQGQSVSDEGYNKHFNDYINVVIKLLALLDKVDDKSSLLYQFYVTNFYRLAVSCYRLLMMNKFQRKNPESKSLLKLFDNILQDKNYELHRKIGQKKGCGCIPYIWLWRKTGFNIFSLIRI